MAKISMSRETVSTDCPECGASDVEIIQPLQAKEMVSIAFKCNSCNDTEFNVQFFAKRKLVNGEVVQEI